MNWLIWLRRCVQLMVVALFCWLPWLALHGWHEVRGTLFAFNLFGIPFADPASAAQAAVAGVVQSSPGEGMFYFGACLSLIVALFLGRVFCGWFCPYGLFSELTHSLRVKANKPMRGKARNASFWGRAGIAFLGIAIAALAGYAFITLISMPGDLSLIPFIFLFEGAAAAGLMTALALPVAALLVELIFGRRFWCEYICPQSVFLGLAAWTLPYACPGLRISRNPRKCSCGKESPCAQACSLNLNPRTKNGPPRRDCSLCGECVAACQKHGGALSFSLREPDA